MLGWLLPKTYKHRCKDGSVKIVHRNVDDAFPFYLPSWKAKLDGNAKIPVQGQGGIKAEYETKIGGLLFGLDELNQGLMMNFRGAYVAFQTDPSAGHEFLLREVAKVLQEQQRVLRIRLQIDGLISLAKTCKNKGEFFQLYQVIVNQVGGSTVADAAAVEIKDSAQQAKKWIGGGNAS